ncbi:hypothetical protein WJX74_005056 [Apatococcus lobatus]|uniref:Uncharacterized protein n=1 Tax=Apatococcus lobatus TaxID=904363 RepID=A0AAW1QLX4_9CHLO
MRQRSTTTNWSEVVVAGIGSSSPNSTATPKVTLTVPSHGGGKRRYRTPAGKAFCRSHASCIRGRITMVFRDTGRRTVVVEYAEGSPSLRGTTFKE